MKSAMQQPTESVEQPKKSLPPSQGRQSKSKPIWLDYFDTFSRAALAVVGAWWAITSFYAQKAQNEHTLQIQIDSQQRALQSQREISEAQLAANLIPYVKCADGEQKLMALLILDSTSPRSATSIANALLRCEQSPAAKKVAQNFALTSSLTELRADFLRELSGARQYRRFGLDSQAAREYEKAYNLLPVAFKTEVDHSAASNARKALESAQFAEAAAWFDSAFKKIQTSP
jgi:hypothetical protein